MKDIIERASANLDRVIHSTVVNTDLAARFVLAQLMEDSSG